MNKHTPGKWSCWYQHDKRDINKPVKVAARAEIVWKGTDRHEERLANAALIAAAPDLVKACIAALRGIGGDDASQAEALAKIRAALALAGIE